MIKKNIISESSRDDKLMPYLKLLQNNGIEINMGQFKSKLLNKLSFEGGITNFSLRSNYYLAGTARYYFNGDLTTNKDVSLLMRASYEGGDTIQDNWNVETCKKVNALINVLRNAYIDSVGTQMLEPEDFGTMELHELLKKYKKPIMKELGIVIPNKKTKEDTIDTNENVGDGYTFEIMYSYQDCQKYKEPTSPGAWCITYAQQHYNYYASRLGIHYVIFRKNGWEEIPRPKNPNEENGFTPQKPHDKYGNSLIAVLQSNKNPEPIYITSRWNHGYEVNCEADHAYTKKEFQEITGVSDADLQRIYDIWKLNKGKKGVSTSNSQKKKELLDITRKLKYIQMRVNSGENMHKLIEVMREPLLGGNIKNGTYIGGVTENETDVESSNNFQIKAQFIVDRGKIVFDSVVLGDNGIKVMNDNYIRCGYQDEKKMKLYHAPSHSFVNIDGCVQFKYMPDEFYKPTELAELKQSKTECALLCVKTGKPLRLPNGQFWCNFATQSRFYRGYKFDCNQYSSMNTCVLEIVYDDSSGESYFYNLNKKQFIEVPSYNEIKLPINCSWLTWKEEPIIYINGNGFYGIGYGTRDGYLATDIAVFNNDSKRFQYKSINRFTNVNRNKLLDDCVILETPRTENSFGRRNCIGFINTAEIVGFGDRPVMFCNYTNITGDYLFLQTYNHESLYFIFSPKDKSFLVNPYNGKDGVSKFMFNIVQKASEHPNGSVILKMGNDAVESEEWYGVYKNYNDNGTVNEELYKIVNLNDIYNNGYHVPASFFSDYNSDVKQQELNETVRITLGDIKIMTENVLKKLLEKC